MDPTSLIDTHKLCMEAIVTEMERFKSVKFFKPSACNSDSRDVDFNTLKCRLAYTYNFGCYTAKLVEKCLWNFLTDYPESESTFPLDNLQVCSLSNGPGLDIIGLFCALFNSSKRLKCFPRLEAINLYNSWLNMYKNVVLNGHEIASTYFYPDYCSIPSENINLIQSDVYANLSAEAVDSISNCNVLLMVNTFLSSKAPIDVFRKTLKKVFLLLKTGTLIFFIGTKNNKKNFLKCISLNKYVKCIYGPQRVTVEKIIFSEDSQKIKTMVPKDSGSAEFMVWLKRDVVIKNNVAGETSDEDSINAESKISSTSSSKQSDSSSDELENSASKKVPYPNDETQNLAQAVNSLTDSMDDISSIFGEMDLENSNDKKILKFLLPHTFKQSYNLENDNQKVEFEAAILTEETKKSPTIQKVNSKMENSLQLKNVEITEKGILYNIVPQLIEDSILSNNTDLSNSVNANENQTMPFPPIIENKLSNEDDRNMPGKCTKKKKKKSAKVLPLTFVEFESLDEIGLKNSSEKKNLKCLQPHTSESVNGNKSNNSENDIQKVEFDTAILTKEITSPTFQRVNSEVENSKQSKNVITEKGGISYTAVPQLTEGSILSNNTHLSNSVNANENQNISFPPIIVNKICNKGDKNTPGKSTPKKKKKKTEKVLPSRFDGIKSVTEASVPHTSSYTNRSSEKLLNFSRNETVQEKYTEYSSDKNNDDLSTLIQRCENLISSLENITVDIKNSMRSKKQESITQQQCSRGRCTTLRVPYACACFYSTMCLCCCRKNCSCHSIKNICTT